jgi:tripartite-type tricarboxylate transporter receptor subunit TctC
MRNAVRRARCGFVAAAAVSSLAWAQAPYPNKPIYIAVGLQAGTGSDIAVRAVADKLRAQIGQQIVIENLAGASGTLAAVKAAKAPPDGYTLTALSNATLTILPNLDSKMPLEPLKELTPVAFVSAIPSVLFVHPAVPAKTVREFVSLAKKPGSQMTYASGGNGSTQHLAMERFKAAAGIKQLLHVPYKGSAQAVLDVIGGRVDCGFQGISTVLPHVQSQKLRALAWSGDKRFGIYPDLPTIQEAGVPGYTYEAWTAFYAPVATSKDVVSRLNVEVRKASNQPDLAKRWAAEGLEAREYTPEQIVAMLRSENANHAKVIKDLNLKLD